jgi:hypothetical protein
MPFLFFLFPSFLLGQEAGFIENGKDYNAALVQPFLYPLYEKSDYVISFRIRQGDKQDEKSDYFILTRKAGALTAYNYSVERDKTTPLPLSPTSLELVWKTFVQNELLLIRDEKDIPVFCPEKYQVYVSHTYEFMILSGGKMKKLSYYDPEYYDEACYGVDERKKIINCAAAIRYVTTGS